ncbi:MAG: hypothetical protein LBH82_03330 [Bacteroidales bacterium]|nr:hypothetical protein [Bacteroidales bacterium]
MGKKTETCYHYGKPYPFVSEDGCIYISCKVNDTTHLFLYRTDGSLPTFEEEIYGNIKFPKTEKNIKVRTIFPGVTVKQGLRYYNIESDFFDHKQYVVRVSSLSSDTVLPKCMPENDENRFYISSNIFPKWNDVMLLSFSDTSITLFDSADRYNATANVTLFNSADDRYDATGFTPVKSVMSSCAGILVYLTVNGTEELFLFNTLDKGYLSLPQSEQYKREEGISVARIFEEDYSFRIINDTLIHQHTNTIAMGGYDSIAGDIFYVKDLYRPTMGMAFITQYDWIIDMSEEGKVYARKIKDRQYEEKPQYYQVNIFDTLLRISLLPVNETKYRLFSIIDSVNGEKITMENICQMKALLNKEHGFTDNAIVVLPPRNTILLED